MKKTLWSCLLSAACIAATTVCIPAQSAPLAGVRAPAQGPDQNERLQRRLSEVIALLEGDDVTAEEQAKARKTLQDIVAQLRNTRTTTPKRSPLAPVEGGAVEVRPGAGVEARPRRAASGAEGVVVEEGGEAPKMRRARAVEDQRGVYQYEGEAVGTAPKAAKPSKVGRADAQRYVEAQPPAAPMAPEAPKARRAYVEYEEMERAHEGAARAHADAAKVYAEREAQGQRELRTSVARARDDAARAGAEAAELRAHAEGLRGQLGVGADRAPGVRPRSSLPTRGRVADPEGEAEIRAMIDEMRKEMREIRSLMQRIRQQAHDEEDEDETPHAESFPSQPPIQPPTPLGHPVGLPPSQPPIQSPTPLGHPVGLPPSQAPGQPPAQPPGSVPGTPFARSHGAGGGFARQ